MLAILSYIANLFEKLTLRVALEPLFFFFNFCCRTFLLLPRLDQNLWFPPASGWKVLTDSGVNLK